MILDSICVSVVIPVRNTPFLILDDTLYSVFQQSIIDSLEVILIDDATDNNDTKDIIDKYDCRYTNMSVIHLSKPVGAAEARNIGLKSVRGTYTIFIDSDDIMSKDYLKNMYEKINTHSADVCVSGFSVFTNSSGSMRIIGKNQLSSNISKLRPDYMLRVSTCPWNKLCKTAFLKKESIQFQSLSSDNDVLFSMMVMLCADSVVYCDEADHFFYRTDGVHQISAKRNPFNFIKSIKSSLQSIKLKQQYRPFYDEIIQTYFIVTSCDEIRNHFDKKEYQEYYEICKEYLIESSINVEFPKARIYLKLWVNEKDSSWINKIGDYDSQLDDHQTDILNVITQYEKIYLWGMGERSRAFVRFMKKHNCIISGICDKDGITKYDVTLFDIDYYPTTELSMFKGLIVASNHAVYTELIENGSRIPNVMDLEVYCPL